MTDSTPTPRPWKLNETGWCKEADKRENQSIIIEAVNQYSSLLASNEKLKEFSDHMNKKLSENFGYRTIFGLLAENEKLVKENEELKKRVAELETSIHDGITEDHP